MSSNKKNLLKTLLTPNAGSCGCGRTKLCDVYEPKPKPRPRPRPKPSSASQNPKLISSSNSSSFDHKNNALSPAMENIDDQLTTSTSNFSFNNIDSTQTTSSTVYSESEPDFLLPSKVSPCPKIVDSVAVVKDSDDPYQDFRQSMVQMITEREIYSRDELRELLKCFLELNSPGHHDVIVKAFMEIWDGQLVISKEVDDDDAECPCVAVVHGHGHGDEHGEKHGSS